MAKEDEDLRDRRAAYHEAGHAVIAWCFGRRIEHLTIVPSGDTGGHILYRTDRLFEWVRPTETWLRVELLCTMAGPVAQNLELGENAWEMLHFGENLDLSLVGYLGHNLRVSPECRLRPT